MMRSCLLESALSQIDMARGFPHCAARAPAPENSENWLNFLPLAIRILKIGLSLTRMAFLVIFGCFYNYFYPKKIWPHCVQGGLILLCRETLLLYGSF